ncbi:MAG: hypothetical protein M1839_006883 [Geoglossum umbratile]|nr:MAG: hypothetical protein M1839_006883 [Geoglossum umbratile]
MTRRPTKTLNKRSRPATIANTSRQSKRLKADKSALGRSNPKSQAQHAKPTPKKSKYFGPQTTSDNNKDEDHGEPSSSESDSDYLDAGFGYDDDNAPSSADPGSEGSSEESAKPKVQQRAARRKPPFKAKLPNSGELLKEGVKTGLAPGKEVRVRLPKAREAGDISYQGDRIHPNTLLFLRDLRDNNDREWLKLHDKDYRNSQKDFESFVGKLTEKVIGKDDLIPELPVKDLIMRIYRDMRFSSDPTPYRTHFGVGW